MPQSHTTDQSTANQKKAASNYINMTSRSQVKSRNQLSSPAGWLQNLKEHKDTDLHRLIRAFPSGKQNHILAITWYLGTVTKVPCILFTACTLCLLFPRCCPFSTAICLLFRHCYAMSTFFHAAVLYLLFYATVSCLPFPHSYALSLFPCCCAMSTLGIPLHLFHAAALCLLFPHCCAVYFFHAAAPCLHFPHCTVISTFPTLLRHDYLFHDAGTCLFSHGAARCLLWYVSILRAAVLCLFFLATVPCLHFHIPMLCLLFLHMYAVVTGLIFPRCWTISTFYAAALCLLFPRYCAISTLSTLLRHVYFFHATIRCYCVMSTFSTL